MKKLSEDELREWRLFRRTCDTVNRALTRAFAEHTELSAAEYGVLDRLTSHGGELRQQQIQESLRWEKDRLSHLLKRMSVRGLIERKRSQGLMVYVTEAGRVAHRAASPVHWKAVRSSYLGRLDARDLKDFARIAKKLIGESTELKSQGGGL